MKYIVWEKCPLCKGLGVHEEIIKQGKTRFGFDRWVLEMVQCDECKQTGRVIKYEIEEVV